MKKIGYLMLIFIFSAGFNNLFSYNKLTYSFFSKYSKPKKKFMPEPKGFIKLKDVPYTKYFWKVYYTLDGKVFGAEFYKNHRLIYYYRYNYFKNGDILIRGFYWRGYLHPLWYEADKCYLMFAQSYNAKLHCLYLYNKDGILIKKDIPQKKYYDYYKNYILNR